MLDVSTPANKHDSQMQAGRAALQQDVPELMVVRDPAAMQSYAQAEEATMDHSKTAGMNHGGPAVVDMDHNKMAGVDHSKMAGMKHGGHSGGMSHDMSDPAMSQSMEADLRTRFFVALLLTIPVILYSPLGQGLLHRTLPTPIPVNWLLFLLTTPIVFWAGWIFVGGAFSALRARTLDMSVLIAIYRWLFYAR